MHVLAPLVVAFALGVPAVAAAQMPTADGTRREAFREYRAGQELLSGERFEQAAERFRAAIAIDATFVDAYYGLGQSYMGLTRYASAAQAYTQCLDAARTLHGLRDKDRVMADRQIADELRELRDTIRRIQALPGQQGQLRIMQAEQRIRDLERSKSSLGGAFVPPAGVLLALGSAHFRNGARDEAERHWRDAAQVDPSLGEAWNNLAVVYLQTSRKAEAQDAATRAERAGFRVHPQLKTDIARLPGNEQR